MIRKVTITLIGQQGDKVEVTKLRFAAGEPFAVILPYAQRDLDPVTLDVVQFDAANDVEATVTGPIGV